MFMKQSMKNLLTDCVVVIGISVSVAARSMDTNSAEILSTNDAEYFGTNVVQRLQRLTFTTEAYRKEALKRVIQEANWAARQLQLVEALPIIETNLLEAYITPYGGARNLHAIGNVTTSNYVYGVSRDYKFSFVIATHVDEDRSKLATQYLWTKSREDTNSAYQLATQWLAAVSMDVKGLNNDCEAEGPRHKYVYYACVLGQLDKRRVGTWERGIRRAFPANQKADAVKRRRP
jgi:hypothetical protein